MGILEAAVFPSCLLKQPGGGCFSSSLPPSVSLFSFISSLLSCPLLCSLSLPLLIHLSPFFLSPLLHSFCFPSLFLFSFSCFSSLSSETAELLILASVWSAVEQKVWFFCSLFIWFELLTTPPGLHHHLAGDSAVFTPDTNADASNNCNWISVLNLTDDRHTDNDFMLTLRWTGWYCIEHGSGPCGVSTCSSWLINRSKADRSLDIFPAS